ncbi:MAG: polysaccharide pyruvyl transferase family protein [Pontiellaceae bacterium]|nr:polysaccharide pyruvyl transferase family protein [Pontiellaceae bacterium]
MNIIDKPKAVILNFTADTYHWGCYGTSMEILQTLTEFGFYVDPVSVMATHHLNPTPTISDHFADPVFFNEFIKENPSIFYALESADLVVINGEGTLHRVSKGSVNLLYMAMAVKRFLNKPVHLINHSCYPNGNRTVPSGKSLIYSMVLPHLDAVVTREVFSHELLKASAVSNTLGFDCLPRFINRHSLASSHKPEGYILLSGGIALNDVHINSMADVVKRIYKKGVPLRFLMGAKSRPAPDDEVFFEKLSKLVPSIEMVNAGSMKEWLDQIRHASFLVSGRFHHTIAAMTIGTPYAVFHSNTPKIEAILQTLNEPLPVLSIDEPDLEQLGERIGTCLRDEQTDISTRRVERMLELAEHNFDNIHNWNRSEDSISSIPTSKAQHLRERIIQQLRQKTTKTSAAEAGINDRVVEKDAMSHLESSVWSDCASGSLFANKRIALVGNALSLFDQTHGSKIDSEFDLVCRFNKGCAVVDSVAQGKRIDIAFFSVPALFNEIASSLPSKETPGQPVVFHVSNRRRDSLPKPHRYVPIDSNEEVARLAGVDRPSCGLMAMWYVAAQKPASVTLFGFDFKNTPTYYDQQRTQEPHDYVKEKNFVCNTLLKQPHWELIS